MTEPTGTARIDEFENVSIHGFVPWKVTTDPEVAGKFPTFTVPDIEGVPTTFTGGNPIMEAPTVPETL